MNDRDINVQSIMGQSYPKFSAGMGSTDTGTASLPGSLRILLDSELAPGETIMGAIVGNTGEALAYSKDCLYVLKSGMATGSLTGRKCKKYHWVNVRDFAFRLSSAYCWLEVIEAGRSPSNYADVNQAKKSDSAVTFLSSRRPEFEQFAAAMKKLTRG